MTFLPIRLRRTMLAGCCAMLCAIPVSAQPTTGQRPAAEMAGASGPTYADLVDLAEGSPLVMKARVKD